MSQISCFHCDQLIEAGAEPLSVLASGRLQPVCCFGCKAVAEAILAGGLDAYYRLKSQLPSGPDYADAASVSQEPEADPRAFDPPEVLDTLTRRDGHLREVDLSLEGVRCAACLWLVESVLAREAGVVQARTNHATRRVCVRWDPEQERLSGLLLALKRFGYGARPWTVGGAEAARRREHRAALWRLLVAALGMMQVMMYAAPAYLAGDGELPGDLLQLLNWASLVLTLPVLGYSSWPFFQGAWRDLRVRRLGPDIPVALGIAVAFASSALAVIRGHGEVWFDSVSMFVFLLLAGRYAELLARERAARMLERLGRALPVLAWRLRSAADPASAEPVVPAMLRPGDILLVRSGETLPADGIVRSGQGLVDQALLSGESEPLACGPGSRVHAGAVNSGQPLVVTVERAGRDTLISSIARLAEQAAAARPGAEDVSRRYTGAFVAAVLSVAVLTALWWMHADPARAVTAVVAVLVATCPCAFALAAPVARIVSVGALASRGVLLSQGLALESLARVTDVVFDKTGTLTLGRPAVGNGRLFRGLTRMEAIRLIATLESGSTHPLARAFTDACAGDLLPAVTDLRFFPGEGVEGTLAGRRLRAGSHAYVRALSAAAEFPDDDARVWLGDPDGPLAAFDVRDELRPGVRDALSDLRALGLQLHLVSGDAAHRVEQLAGQLGIAHVAGDCMPGDKRELVAALQAQGRVVLVVGDGMNDAPVLGQADVSVAMAEGATLAQARADAVLLDSGGAGPDLRALALAVSQARRTLGITRQNLIWSICYNFSVLPLAVTGWLTPWAAALGMSFSSVVVVLNALRLARRPSGIRTGEGSRHTALVVEAGGDAR